MIEELCIEDFRCFPKLQVAGLGRLNLLVGTNNSGKSSVLDAVQILAAHGDPRAIVVATRRRGERIWNDTEDRVVSEADISHLFRGHSILPGTSFCLSATSQAGCEHLRAEILDRIDDDEEEASGTGFDDEADFLRSVLHLNWDGKEPTSINLPLSRRGGLSLDSTRRVSIRSNGEAITPVYMITTASLTPEETMALFDDIVLTDDESLVIEALRTIEPDIERIATTSMPRRRPYGDSRYGILVKCRDIEQRVPIGSMGDGIWRMLGLALSLVKAENGILLVDEIDTGLHFTVMSEMWKLVNETSKRLNVQVFATSHSRDCYESLASVCHEEVLEGSEVTLQRLERGREAAIRFSEQEILLAASRGIEVR